MATLAANNPRAWIGGDNNHLPVVASDIIYGGAAVGLASGLARPLTAGDPFAGFAIEKADNSAGGASAINVEVRAKGVTVLEVTGVTAVTDIGAAVYASDDDTFTLTASTNSYIGRVVHYVGDGTKVHVAFDATRGGRAAITALTDSSGGTANNTIAAITALDTSDTYTDAAVNAVFDLVADALADLAAKVNGLIAQQD